MHAIYTGGDKEVRRVLDAVLNGDRLRKWPRVRGLVAERCFFFVVGSDLDGHTMPLSVVKPVWKTDPDHFFVIALFEGVLLGDLESAKNLVAHEIAHAWLWDQGKRTGDWAEDERAAVDQAEVWGFDRV